MTIILTLSDIPCFQSSRSIRSTTYLTCLLRSEQRSIVEGFRQTRSLKKQSRCKSMRLHRKKYLCSQFGALRRFRKKLHLDAEGSRELPPQNISEPRTANKSYRHFRMFRRSAFVCHSLPSECCQRTRPKRNILLRSKVRQSKSNQQNLGIRVFEPSDFIPDFPL